MKFFFDTEFIEDGKTIDLVSIGIVAEDGREYYAISKEFNASNADDWVKANVLAHLPKVEAVISSMPEGIRGIHAKNIYPPEYKTRSQIRNDVLTFAGQDNPEFWAYYADYDWVVLCQLFGRMVDLPDGWPYYCRDLKQLIDSIDKTELPECKDKHHALADARWVKQVYESLVGVPIPGGKA